MLKGHSIEIVELDAEQLDGCTDHLSDLLDAKTSIIIVRNVFQKSSLKSVSARLLAPNMDAQWTFPNKGMKGGDIRTIGAAATPTFTSFGGPSLSDYRESARTQQILMHEVFDSLAPTSTVSAVLSKLFAGRPASVANDGFGECWLPFNFRALDLGQQIYPHHDNHYRLSIYDAFDAGLDRSQILSWFTLLQPAERGGELIVYGLWGSDPNPPVLPSRFLDTDVLEREYRRVVVRMEIGDLVLFNSGCHVHRVSEVQSHQSRLTMGGFATVDQAKTRLAYWS